MATQKFAASTSTSDGLTVWPWTSGTGFGTRYAAPASPPVSYVTGAYAPRFNSKCTSLLCTTQGTPFVQGWRWSPSGYGTKYSNPAVLPTTPTGLSFLDDNEIAISSSAGSFIYTYPFDSVTGYGTRYASTGAQSAQSVTSKGGAAFFAHLGTPFISMYPRAYPGFGTKYANPSSLPSAPTTAAGARGSLLSVTDANIVMQQTAAPNYAAWPWTLAGGFGTRYTATNMTTGMTGLTCYVTDSMLPSYAAGILVIAGSATGGSNFIKIAQWSNGYFPPQGTTYANPSTAPFSYPNSIDYDRTTDPGTIFLSIQNTAYIQAWSIYAGSWGTRYANSSSDGGGYGVTFGILQESMTANVGSFAFTGNAATLTKSTSAGYTLTASVGSFSLTGKAAGLAIGRKATAAQGAFSLSGIAAGLKVGRVIAATTQSFALTGIATNLKAARTITGAVRTFALTGINNRLATTRTITATAQSFSLTGYDANLVATTSKTLFAATGHFVLTGIANQFLRGYVVSFSVGTFSLAGQSTQLAAARALTATIGPFALTGVAASLTTQRLVVCAKGTFTLTGNNAILLRTTAAQAGSFGLVGYSAVLRVGRSVAAAQATFALVGSAAVLIRNFNLPASSRSFALSGIAAAITTSRKVAPDSGSFAESGKVIGLYYGRVALGATGQFLLTGNTVSLGKLRGIVAGTGQFALSGIDSILVGPLPPVIRSIVLGEATIAPITTSEIVVSSTSALGNDGSCHDYTSLYSESP